MSSIFLGHPVWMWVGFLGVVGVLLAFDLGVLHRKGHEIGARESILLSAFYIALGLGFGGLIALQLGRDEALEYVTAFVVEKSLAVDNLFVIATIFTFLAIPRVYQHRVLFWGVLGVIVLRGVMIGVGATLVSEFEWVLYIFGVFLILTGVKMLLRTEEDAEPKDSRIIAFVRRHARVTDKLHGDRFFVRQPDSSGRMALYATPLFLALAVIEVADIVFAVDSVPAVFAITTDPYIVYTSNIFAILGLRALYFALAAVMHRFAYLKTALAILLMFVGAKIFAADLLGLEKIPAEFSLSITFAILAGGILYSMWRTRQTAAEATNPENEDPAGVARPDTERRNREIPHGSRP